MSDNLAILGLAVGLAIIQSSYHGTLYSVLKPLICCVPGDQVAGWLFDALTMLLGDTIPCEEEAQKFVVGFAASLNDPNLKVAPALHVMPSMTTLTPHYAVSMLRWL